jgi:hypothetical protein
VAVAASLVILAGTYLILSRETKSIDTFSDPAVAYAETMKILYSVSVQMNKGTSALEPVSRINEITAKSIGELNATADKIERNLGLFSREIRKADTAMLKAKN